MGNVSQAILWGITNKHNSMRRKGKFTDFTRDPFSTNNMNSYRDVGLLNDAPRVGVAAGKGMKMTVSRKCTRRFVNARPHFDRKGAENKGYKAPKTLKNKGFSVETMNDKNAAVAMRNAAPGVQKRITKLHKANCRAARAGKAATN